MTIIQFSEQLQQQVKSQMEVVQGHTSITKASKMMSIVQDAIADLQQFTHNYEFTSMQEEITFFKEIKPVLLSQYYFYRSQFNITLSDSFQDVSGRRSFYESELQKLEHFTKRNYDFYVYCITGQTYLDQQYFTRKTTPLIVGIDPRFSTGFDEKLAQLLSQELTRKNINERITQLINQSKPSLINWTGNKTDAVELIAALHATGSLNNGEAEMKQLIKSFEECFNISLDNYYDLFKKIRLRKGTRSNFIDKLKEKFDLRLNQMEE